MVEQHRPGTWQKANSSFAWTHEVECEQRNSTGWRHFAPQLSNVWLLLLLFHGKKFLLFCYFAVLLRLDTTSHERHEEGSAIMGSASEGLVAAKFTVALKMGSEKEILTTARLKQYQG